MCGRFFQDVDERALRAHFGVPEDDGQLGLLPEGRYNIGPGQHVWVVRSRPDNHVRSLDAVHWGLVPHFARDRKGAYRCINARAESIERTPTFRAAFGKRRCLVPARGFFEWKAEGKRKQPFAIAAPDVRLMAFAGVWENWLDRETGEWMRSVAIITTDASPALSGLHDRMPVILAPADYARWLGEEPARPEELKALLRPFPGALRVWPVSDRMNRAALDAPENLAEIALAPAVEAAEPDRPCRRSPR